MKRQYENLYTGKITLYVIKYSTFRRKKLRYICYDQSLGWNIYEEVSTHRKYAITDDTLFREVC